MRKQDEIEKKEEAANPPPPMKDTPRYKVTAIQGGVRKTGVSNFLNLIHGDYCGKVLVNDKKAWDIQKDISSRPLTPIPDEDLLPSDCRFRIDRGTLIDGDMDEADKAKSFIEELQSHDYRLRDSVPPQ